MKSTHRALAFLAASAPTAVLAQTGMVTTSPLAQPVPAMGLVALAITIATLAFVAARRLRLGPAAASVLALTLLTIGAAGGYAGVSTSVIISGAECNKPTTEAYALDVPAMLLNQCPNSIQIDAIDASCNYCETLPGTACEAVVPQPPLSSMTLCEAGVVIPAGQTCELPTCTR